MGQFQVGSLFDLEEFEHVYEGILVLDENLVCKYLNNVCLGFIDKPLQNLLGKEISEYFPFRNQSKVLSILYETIKDQKLRKFQEEISFSEEKKFWFEFCVTSYEGGVVLHLYNMTEQKNFEKELLENELIPFLYQFVSSLAHDITSKLSVADATLELIRKDFPKSNYIQNAHLSVHQAIDMSKKLLQVGREKKIDRFCIQLSDVIEINLENYRQLAGPQVFFDVKLAPKLNKILIDPTALDQIISNLVSNARDALPNGGRVLIETQAKTVFTPILLKTRVISPGEYVVLTFSDNGIGVEERDLERIFMPYFTTKEKDKGTGLGLAIVLEKINEAGAHIQVVSKKNIGTTFTLYFPTSFDKK